MENNTSTTADSGNDAKRVLCPVFLFRFFFRSTFSDTDATNEELDEINIEFSEYLRKKCTEKQLQNFMPKSEIDVILNKNHPLRTNGFDPAFVLHFLQFAEIEAKKHKDTNKFICCRCGELEAVEHHGLCQKCIEVCK